MKFCPICAALLTLVQHESPSIGVYWLWECPEQDWFEPAPSPEEDEEPSE